VDLQSRMPVRILTQDPNGATSRQTDLGNVKINVKLADKDFVLEPINEKDWTITQEAYDD
jgi:outer membrane lipoprotein-sorting protein